MLLLPPPPAHRCLLVLRLSAAHLLLSNGRSTCILLTKWRKTECASVASFIWMLPKVCNTWSRKTLINSPPHEKDTSASGMISHRIRDSDLPTGAWANIVELTKLNSIRNSMHFSFHEDLFKACDSLDSVQVAAGRLLFYISLSLFGSVGTSVSCVFDKQQ